MPKLAVALLFLLGFFLASNYVHAKRKQTRIDQSRKRWQEKLRGERVRLLNPGLAMGKRNDVIRLVEPSTETNAYYTNKFARIDFCLEDIFPETLNDYPIYAGFEDITEFEECKETFLKLKNGERSDRTFEQYLPIILESGIVRVTSKTTLELVHEIRKQEWVSGVDGTFLAKGFGYALQDGTVFFKVTTVVG
jgi:hypothetical protein